MLKLKSFSGYFDGTGPFWCLDGSRIHFLPIAEDVARFTGVFILYSVFLLKFVIFPLFINSLFINIRVYKANKPKCMIKHYQR